MSRIILLFGIFYVKVCSIGEESSGVLYGMLKIFF